MSGPSRSHRGQRKVIDENDIIPYVRAAGA